MQSWLCLMAAVLLEVAGTTSMKLSAGFTRLIPSIFLFVFYVLSFIALTYALKTIELSIAYAVWSGIGTALIAIIGIAYFKEPVSAPKILSLVFIIIGVVGLQVSGAHYLESGG